MWIYEAEDSPMTGDDDDDLILVSYVCYNLICIEI